MKMTKAARHRTSVVILSLVAAIAIAAGGFVVGHAARPGRAHPFENTAATRPIAGSTTTSTTAPGRLVWSLVQQPNGSLTVLRGKAVSGLHPNAVIASGARVLSVETDVAEHSAVTAGENDPLRSQQWALDQTSFERAWSVTSGAGVTVAVIDTGVDAAHEDLGSVVLPGIDYVEPSLDGRYDPDGHGTHVAGIIAARVNNDLGIAGAAPSVRILPVRVLDATGSGVSSNVAAGIIWATDHGARVISMSLGGGPSPGIEIAMQYAISKGSVVLAAAGNNGAKGNAPVYPAAYPEAIAVGAFAENLQRAPFSNFGAYVDISAPGNDILSTWSSSPTSYAVASGTSMATPYASAEAALIISRNPALSVASVTSILESTARDAGAPGSIPTTGTVSSTPPRPCSRQRRGSPVTAARATATGSSDRREACSRTGSYRRTARVSSARRRSRRRARRVATATGSSPRPAPSTRSAMPASTGA